MRDIEGLEGRYCITSEGRIWSYPKSGKGGHQGKWIKGFTDKDGYINATLSSGHNKEVKVKNHRLVASAYIPNPKQLPHVNHINGIKHDNRVENLEWTTHAENMRHAKDNGLTTKPEKARWAKLDWDKVNKIRESEEKPAYLAGLYSVSPETIYRVRNRKIWR